DGLQPLRSAGKANHVGHVFSMRRIIDDFRLTIRTAPAAYRRAEISDVFAGHLELSLSLQHRTVCRSGLGHSRFAPEIHVLAAIRNTDAVAGNERGDFRDRAVARVFRYRSGQAGRCRTASPSRGQKADSTGCEGIGAGYNRASSCGPETNLFISPHQ